MADNVIFEYLNTYSGKAKFADICREETALAQNIYKGGIGTLGEKRMHRIIKRAICEDEACCEIKISDALLRDGITSTPIAKRTVADVFRDSEIFEVQTSGFRPLHDKLLWCLESTPYDISLIYPLAEYKILHWINPQTGDITTTGKYRKYQKITSVARELYWILPIVESPEYRRRFRLVMPLLRVREYKITDGWSHDGKHGATKYERIPELLEDVVILKEPEDYAKHFLPETLPRRFTAAEYIKATGIRTKVAYSTLNFLLKIGVLSEGEKSGRAKTWVRCNWEVSKNYH